jgi:hypothetical protein
MLTMDELRAVAREAADHLGDHWCLPYKRDHTGLAARLTTLAAAPPPSEGLDTFAHAPVQYDGGCTAHGGTTERHCAVDGHPMPAPPPSEPTAEQMVAMGCPPEAAWQIARSRDQLAAAPAPSDRVCTCGPWEIGQTRHRRGCPAAAPIPSEGLTAEDFARASIESGITRDRERNAARLAAPAQSEGLDAGLMQDVRKLVDAVLTWQTGHMVEHHARNVRVSLEAIDRLAREEAKP